VELLRIRRQGLLLGWVLWVCSAPFGCAMSKNVGLFFGWLFIGREIQRAARQVVRVIELCFAWLNLNLGF
jgi:hypothetical protein